MKIIIDEQNNQRGTALVTAIFGILIGSLIGVALAFGAMTTLNISKNDRESTEAFYIADAGIIHASNLINRAKKGSYSTILTTGANSTPNTGDELSAPPESGLWTSAESVPAGNNTTGGFPFGSGRYWVSVRNDTATGETASVDKNGILIVTSTGVGPDGASATIEAVVKSVAISIPGLLSNGDAKFTGNLQVLGPYGIIQINGSPQFTGSGVKCAAQRFEFMTSSASIPDAWVGSSCTTTPSSGSTLLFNQPRAIPPIYDIPRLQSQFKPLATYVFKDNGAIHPQTNGVERTVGLTFAEKLLLGLGNWTYNSTKNLWDHKTDTRLPDGAYYFQNSNVNMSKGGDSTNPPKVTIFAEGYVSLISDIALQPLLTGYSIVSANDVTMSSKYSTSSNPGMVYAYGQIKLSVSTTIFGGMIAANYYRADGSFGPDVDPPNENNQVNAVHGAVQNSGNTYIITSDFGFVVGSTVISWREVRN